MDAAKDKAAHLLRMSSTPIFLAELLEVIVGSSFLGILMLSEVLIHCSVEIAPLCLVFIHTKNNAVELTTFQAVLSIPDFGNFK